VREQFALLRELQRLDDRLRALKVAQQQLPQQLQPYELAGVEAHRCLEHGQAELVNKERQRRALERELENGQAQLAKTQLKLHEVKTNKEYSAVLVEITVAKQRITVLEDQILELMESLEQQRQTVRKQEQNVQETGQQLNGQREVVQQAHATLQQQIGAEESQRHHVVTALRTPLYLAYQRLAAQRHGQVVVEVQAETCGGCHLKVRPQLLSEIRQQDKLVPCPHCQRLLLWPLGQDGQS
jgi:hypothetical protein